MFSKQSCKMLEIFYLMQFTFCKIIFFQLNLTLFPLYVFDLNWLQWSDHKLYTIFVLWIKIIHYHGTLKEKDKNVLLLIGYFWQYNASFFSLLWFKLAFKLVKKEFSSYTVYLYNTWWMYKYTDRNSQYWWLSNNSFQQFIFDTSLFSSPSPILLLLGDVPRSMWNVQVRSMTLPGRKDYN